MLFNVFPIEDRLNLLPIALAIIAFAIFDFAVNIMGVLRQRFYLDTIPDNIRNSIYSLIPTAILIFSAFIMLFAGSVIEQYGFSATLLAMTVVGTISALIMFLGFHIMPKEREDRPRAEPSDR